MCVRPRGEIGYYGSIVNWFYFTSTSAVSSLTGGALWMLSGGWHLPVWENYFCVFVWWHRKPSCHFCYFWLHNMYLCCNKRTRVEKNLTIATVNYYVWLLLCFNQHMTTTEELRLASNCPHVCLLCQSAVINYADWLPELLFDWRKLAAVVTQRNVLHRSQHK